jgi:hypothetical protein
LTRSEEEAQEMSHHALRGLPRRMFRTLVERSITLELLNNVTRSVSGETAPITCISLNRTSPFVKDYLKLGAGQADGVALPSP